MKLFSRSMWMLAIAISAVACAQNDRAPYVTVAYKTEGRHSDILVSEIRPTISATYTYYNALGWTGGYTGLQMTDKGPGFIFSIWDPPGTEKSPGIRAIYALPGSTIERFGGEGTGVHYLDTHNQWSMSRWYRFVVRCWGTDPTYFALWTQDETTGIWLHHVTLEAPESSSRFDTWLYSFLEDWMGTGDKRRRVEYRWPKIHTLSNQWFAITWANASVSPNSAKGAYAEAFDMGTNSDGSIFVQSGADTKTSFAGTSTQLSDQRAEHTSAPDTPPISIAHLQVHLAKGQVQVQWSVPPTATPQFAFKIELLHSADDHGNPIAMQQYIGPDAHQASLDLPANAPSEIFLRLTLTDLFDRPISMTAPVIR